MLTLNDGRSELWQWDTGRTLAVDADCSQVHFSNKVFGRSIDVDVVEGVAIIPDILLQTDKELTAWAFVGTAENGYTKISKTYKVNRRNKPADYVFTPTDQTTLGEILERLDDIESAQDPDAIKNAVEDYLDNNPIRIEETDPTVPNWAKQPTKPQYTAAEVGALPDTYTPPAAPVQSVNGKTGAVNLTAEDVGALPANTEIPLPGITEETDPTVETWAKTSIPAAVGQYFKVSAVDENGNVTAVEAVDAPSGGGGEAWRLIKTITVAEDVAVIDAFTTDNDGNEFSLSAVKVVSDTAVLGESSTSTSGAIRVWVSKRDTINAGNNRDIMPSNAFIEPAFPNANVGLYAEMQKHDCVATMKTNVAGGSVNTIERTCYADANIERIAFRTGNPNALFIGAGSILYVWGIDA